MKFFLLFFVSTCSAAVFQVPTTSTGSLRAKMMREGTYSDFLTSQHAARLQQLNTGSQSILEFSDDKCVGNITVGTPPQVMSVFMDTKSANMWVIDASCNSADCNGDPASGITRHKFNTTMSTSLMTSRRMFSIHYGAGNCVGYFAMDNIQIGGIPITEQVFGIARAVDSYFRIEPFDGILGLAWPPLSIDQVTPPMQNLIAQNQLDAPMFTVWLGENDQKSYERSTGLFTYGGLDTKNCDANTTYASLTSKTYWQFEIDGFKIGPVLRGIHQAITDTGSSWFGFPPRMFLDVASQTNATWDLYTESYTVPCSTIKSQPDLIFTIRRIPFPIKPTDYIVDVGLPDGKCVIAMYQISTGGFGPAISFGNVFTRRYCNVFDVGNERI